MAEEAQFVTLIPVKKVNRAIKFYTKTLGAEVLERGAGDMKDFWASLRIGGTDVWFVAPDKREKHKLAYHTFIVKDIKAFVGDLQESGVKFEKPERMSKRTKVEGPIAYDPTGATAFFKDSENNLLMAFQNPSS